MLITAGFVSVFLIIFTVTFFSTNSTYSLQYWLTNKCFLVLSCSVLNNAPQGRTDTLVWWNCPCGKGERRRMMRRCCYITVDSATTALQNGACTHTSVHFLTNALQNTLFTQRLYMKNLEIYENYITLFCLKKKQLF